MDEQVLLGLLIGAAKCGDFEMVDVYLHELDEEDWLSIELETLDEVKEYVYDRGFDIYEFERQHSI